MVFEFMRLSACLRAVRRIEDHVIEKGSVGPAYAK